ncbi:hypothetical protein BCR42DRAFT_439769 [Absidia repens]|uniref:Uncharacterized protein n=1 Tax=Absidia repens TaxID=90262 RepID=A0A1X2IA44_9FUNG|nr:hypothetical protein BCR42DRAFT_439769 [Absidia repens]
MNRPSHPLLILGADTNIVNIQGGIIEIRTIGFYGSTRVYVNAVKPNQVADILEEAHFWHFVFWRIYHPLTNHAAVLRKDIGKPTVYNISSHLVIQTVEGTPKNGAITIRVSHPTTDYTTNPQLDVKGSKYIRKDKKHWKFLLNNQLPSVIKAQTSNESGQAKTILHAFRNVTMYQITTRMKMGSF